MLESHTGIQPCLFSFFFFAFDLSGSQDSSRANDLPFGSVFFHRSFARFYGEEEELEEVS